MISAKCCHFTISYLWLFQATLAHHIVGCSLILFMAAQHKRKRVNKVLYEWKLLLEFVFLLLIVDVATCQLPRHSEYKQRSVLALLVDVIHLNNTRKCMYKSFNTRMNVKVFPCLKHNINHVHKFVQWRHIFVENVIIQ